MVLYREELDVMGCAVHGTKEGGVWFHSACHPKSPTWAKYENGKVEITCAKCRQLLVEIAVAKKG